MLCATVSVYRILQMIVKSQDILIDCVCSIHQIEKMYADHRFPMLDTPKINLWIFYLDWIPLKTQTFHLEDNK